jgi:hypothetical protein
VVHAVSDSTKQLSNHGNSNCVELFYCPGSTISIGITSGSDGSGAFIGPSN